MGQNPPNLDIYEPSELGHADAEFVPHLNLIRVSQEIWDPACNGHPEAKLVLAHETGHVVLEHYAAAGLYSEQHIAVNPETDSEYQANWFADELLMDSRCIDLRTDGVGALISRFHVSVSMATRRIRELLLEGKV